jgi:DNA polymerase-3 subunit delta'
VFIIHDADRMLSYSANALLKTFEEPGQDTIIILLSSSPAALLPTVLSRCRSIFFNPLSEQEIASFVINRFNKTEEEAGMIAAMSQGSVGQAVRLANQDISPIRGLLLDFLQKGKWGHFKELTGIAAEIAGRIDAEKKEIEVEIRKTLLKGAGEDLSVTQKQALEKEVDGAVTMYAMQEAYALFEIVLAWYRDAHLLKLNGNPAYLMHRDYVDSCRRLSQNDVMPLETVQTAIAEVKLLLERSTSLQICLENLFLKLH